ncbi:TVP38/TMEM64 family protein [Longimicrobium sp.]|uniref:TVP38/TMEM64 family protein n=1 Tax=Longimicrobium sp. TaxID=2029185 RepID=UPI002E329D06|nr:VTT domain-containing protein [Longimicrobium sp.]HEX6038257.1 VTT domain-containing protein [Longimicrobium sp.]
MTVPDAGRPGPTVAYLDRSVGRRRLGYVLLALVLLAAVVTAGREIDRHLAAIESGLRAMGPWGALLYAGGFAVLTSMLLPESVLTIAAGALFGPVTGVLTVVCGHVMAALLQFVLARRLLRGAVQRTVAARPQLVAIQRVAARSDWKMQALLRLTPLNQALVSYLLGAAGVRFAGFLLAIAGLLPAVLMETYLGAAGRHAARMTGSAHTGGMHDLAMLGGLVVCVAVMAVVSRRARAELAKELRAREGGTVDDG